MIKKIFLLFIFALFSINLVSAVNFNSNQNDVYTDYLDENLGNKFSYFVNGNTNLNSSFFNIEYDKELFLVKSDQDYYYHFDTNVAQTIEFYLLLKNDTRSEYIVESYAYNVTSGEYYFKLDVEKEESAILLIDLPNGNFLNTYLQTTNPKSFDAVFNAFLPAIITIVEVNFGLWKIMFFLLIGGIIVNSILGIFIVLIRIFLYVKELSEEKNRMMRGKR